ncbi:hypothetical protein [Clostridium beijerinckii]|uniref:Uncharacterized protein n=1 Tax=Clostridium beijerinckii TaxID=1520 RepID=A0AAE5LN44_CLOBE|nr:hypothetical protein [Clostridium beijerinckii]NSB12111.1 hypothetical protein [Clostridium beijerinckii]OOM27445.1 hypothetical protein CLOBE_30030 [Clostridium beijerinckii]
MDKVKTISVRFSNILKPNKADNIPLTDDFIELCEEGKTLTYLKIKLDMALYTGNENFTGSATVYINGEPCVITIDSYFELYMGDRIEITSLKINKYFESGFMTMLERVEY